LVQRDPNLLKLLVHLFLVVCHPTASVAP